MTTTFSYYGDEYAFCDVENRSLIVGGCYGTGSHDTTPAQIISVFNNLDIPDS
jgi:pyruvate-ferredoxin/flavodoxin oxidoreductase